MLARYFTVLAIFLMLAFIIRHLLNRQQQNAVNEIVSLTAKVMLIASLCTILWRLFQSYAH